MNHVRSAGAADTIYSLSCGMKSGSSIKTRVSTKLLSKSHLALRTEVNIDIIQMHDQ
jgi:hypothetical protein